MLGEGVRQHLRGMAVDRSRILLVTLGVAWGTLSLTVVLCFGDELHSALMRALRASGRDLIIIWHGATTRPHAGMPPGRPIALVPEDARLLRQQVPGIRSVSVEYASSGVPLEYRGRRTNARVHGVEPSYGEIRCFLPEPGGRFLNERSP